MAGIKLPARKNWKCPYFIFQPKSQALKFESHMMYLENEV